MRLRTQTESVVHESVSGMQSLGILLEFCPPGTLPEASVLAAMLDIQAPVLARAAFFLECAQFVYRLNQGKWPDWMKQTTPAPRSSGTVGKIAVFHRAVKLNRCRSAQSLHHTDTKEADYSAANLGQSVLRMGQKRGAQTR